MPENIAERQHLPNASTDGSLTRNLNKTGVWLGTGCLRQRKDGRFLIFEDGEQGGALRRDLWLLPIGGEPQPLLKTRFYERGAVMSPDGNRLAFVQRRIRTRRSVRAAISRVRSKTPVSTNGGIQPIWARSGRELFYREGETLMAVPVQPQPYEVLSTLGAGGMGEVYRARDTRFKRDVALKVLPESVSTDPERLVRFEREAQTLAALNHPHIAAIFGIEESNRTSALVMELVEGPTLG